MSKQAAHDGVILDQFQRQMGMVCQSYRHEGVPSLQPCRVIRNRSRVLVCVRPMGALPGGALGWCQEGEWCPCGGKEFVELNELTPPDVSECPTGWRRCPGNKWGGAIR